MSTEPDRWLHGATSNSLVVCCVVEGKRTAWAGQRSHSAPPPAPPLAAKAFHARRQRTKALLTNWARQCRRISTDADVLHLGPPDPVLSTKRWLPPDHGLRVHWSAGGLAAALAALAAAVGEPHERPQRLQRLELSTAAVFVLPNGALVPTALLAAPEGQQLAAEVWPGVGVQHDAAEQRLVLTWPQATGRVASFTLSQADPACTSRI